MAYQLIEDVLSEKQRNLIAVLFLQSAMVQSITYMDYVNIFATAEDMKENKETFMKRVINEAAGVYKARGGGEEPILVAANKEGGKFINKNDYDGLPTEIHIAYISDIVANGGATGLSGVEGAVIVAALEAGLTVANIPNTAAKGGAGGGEEKSKGKAGICALHVIRNAFPRLGKEWLISEAKEHHMGGKTFAELQAPAGRPLFAASARAKVLFDRGCALTLALFPFPPSQGTIEVLKTKLGIVAGGMTEKQVVAEHLPLGLPRGLRNPDESNDAFLLARFPRLHPPRAASATCPPPSHYCGRRELHEGPQPQGLRLPPGTSASRTSTG